MDIGEPKEGEVRVRNKAIGLNFIDVYFRKGVYKAATMPFTPGSVLFFKLIVRSWILYKVSLMACYPSSMFR